jgi:DNA-binding transcriptional LysR family regulator
MESTMELRQLRHFLALAEEQSFTRAAQREHIVQSGLSNSIHSLERELDTPLYVRGSRPIRLTAAGFALEGPARRTLSSAIHGTRSPGPCASARCSWQNTSCH